MHICAYLVLFIHNLLTLFELFLHLGYFMLLTCVCRNPLCLLFLFIYTLPSRSWNIPCFFCFLSWSLMINNEYSFHFNRWYFDFSLKFCLYLQDLIMLWFGILEGLLFLLLVACSISPHIAMSSVSDYKVRKCG